MANDNNSSKDSVSLYEYNLAVSWEKLGGDVGGKFAGDENGTSISLSSDGSLIASGAPKTDSNTGAVYVYKFDNIAPIINSTSPSQNATSVDLDSNIVLNFSEPIHSGAGNI